MEINLKELTNKLLEFEKELDKAHKLISDMTQEQINEMKEHQDFCINAEKAVQNERIRIINEIKSISIKSLTADNETYYLIEESDLDSLIENGE